MKQIYPSQPHRGKVSLFQKKRKQPAYSALLEVAFTLTFSCLYLLATHSYAQVSGTWQGVGNANLVGLSAEYLSLALNSEGTPYIAYKDYDNAQKATVKKFNGTSWVTVGDAGFSEGSVNQTAIALDAQGTPYVVYKDGANGGKATVMKFNGTSWVTVGAAGFSAGEQIQPSLTIDANGTPYVAYRDVANGYKATVMKFNGISWETVGTAGLSAGGATHVSLALNAENVPYLAYSDATISNKIKVEKFNGTTWEAVGTTTLFPSYQNYKFSFKLDANGTPYVACRATAMGDFAAVVLKFNGTDWETVGNAGFSAGEIREIALGLDAAGAPYVFYRDMANGLKATVKKYDGTAWQTVGTEAFSVNEIKDPNLVLTAAGVPVVAYFDDEYFMTPTVMKFAAGAPVVTAQPAAKTVTAGGNTNFTVTATGDGTLSYQWQVSEDGGVAFKNISNNLIYQGANTVKLTLSNVPFSMNNYLYRVLITNNSTATSDAVKLTVKTPIFDDGRIWQAVGTPGFSAGKAEYVSMDLNNEGLPYVAFTDEEYGNKLTVMRFDGSNWVLVGPRGFSTNTGVLPTLSLDAAGTPYVLFWEQAETDKAIVMKYNGTNWVTVGQPGFTSGRANKAALAFDSHDVPFLTFKDYANSERATVLKFNGTGWVNVGTAGFSAGRAEYLSLAISSNDVPYVIFTDNTNGAKANVMKYNGTSWISVGPQNFTEGTVINTKIVFDSNDVPYISFIDWTKEQKASVMKFNGAAWELVGNAAFSTAINSLDIALDAGNTPIVAGTSNGGVIVMRYSGTAWENVGAKLTFSPVYGISIVVDSNGNPYVGYRDNGNGGKVTVRTYAVRPNSAPTNISLSQASVAENVAAGTTVGSFTTTDADAGNTHTYTLVAGTGAVDNSSFVIDGSALKISLSPDFETKSSYSIRVKTDDGQGGTFEKAFTVAVVNVNEAPTAIALSKRDINENNQVGAEVGTFSTTDQDTNDSHTYTLVAGDGDVDNAAFSIQGNVLKATVSFDYETKNSYSIRVRTRDAGGLTFESVKVISINDVQEVVTSLSKTEIDALQVYPNPASHTLVISTDYVIDNVSLVNAYGSTVMIKRGGAKQVQLNVSAVSPGVYTAIISSNGKTYIRRIVVTK